MGTADERYLIAAARAGDERAFGRLAARHRPGLELFCLLMLWTELDRGTPSASARIWLYRLATDVCLEDVNGIDESGGPRPFDGVRHRNEPSQ
jgi:hypothetical protein